MPKELENKDVSLEEIEKIGKALDKSGDLSQQLYFLTNSNKRIDDEVKERLDELRYLRKQNTTDGFAVLNEISNQEDNSSKAQRTKEKVIYRLKQLGFVQDWTVERFYTWNLQSKLEGSNYRSIRESVLKTIYKYAGESDLEGKWQSLVEDKKKDKKNAEEQLIKVLLKWNYDHFVYQRRQSLQNIYKACNTFESPDKFKSIVEGYFRKTPSSSKFEEIKDATPSSAIDIIRQLVLRKDGSLVSNSQFERMSVTLLRYLEGYRDNPGVDLMSALLCIALGEFSTANGKPRFINYLKNLAYSENVTADLNSLVNLLCKFRFLETEIAFECIFDGFQEVDLAARVLEEFDSTSAQLIIVNNLNSRLEALL